MSEFFKSKKKFGFALSAVFVAITLVVASVAFTNQSFAAGIEPDETVTSAPGEGDAEPQIPVEPTGSSPEETAPEPAPSTTFNAPAEMKGTFLLPGVDFLKDGDSSAEAVKGEVDEALASAEGLGINTVIVGTLYEDQVIYQTKDAPGLSSEVDILGYILEKAKEKGLYTYGIFDTSLYESRSLLSSLMTVGGGAPDKLAANLEEFVKKYPLDGVLLDGYAAEPANLSYSAYLNNGGGIGFENFMRQSPAAAVKTASKTIRKAAPGVMVGLLADPVWENKASNPEGSDTDADYTALRGGNADTKSFVEKGYVDFVAVKAYTTTEDEATPFSEVVSWWADVTQNNDVPLYVVHETDKLDAGDEGWSSAQQLTEQMEAIAEISGVRGSIFNNLPKVTSDSSGIASAIQKVYGALSGETEQEQAGQTQQTPQQQPSRPAATAQPPAQQTVVGSTGQQVTETASTSKPKDPPKPQVEEDEEDEEEEEEVKTGSATSTKLTVTKPVQKVFTTADSKVTFDGSGVPGTSITINGEEAESDSTGHFSELFELQTGVNTFVIVQGSERIVYTITRKTAVAEVGEILEDASPMGSVTVASGEIITIRAEAYKGAEVYATINGARVAMTAESAVNSEWDAETIGIFSGKYTAPTLSANENERELGRIVVYAEYDDEEEFMQAATVKVSRTATGTTGQVSGGTLVRISADQARTYPTTTQDNTPDSRYYPLPAGALDFAVGSEIVTNSGSYYNLASGLRVASQDVTTATGFSGNNTISGVTASSDSAYTTVTVSMSQPVSYAVSYTSSGISFKFSHTASAPSGVSLTSNSLFSSASWSGTTLTLNFARTNGFIGYKATYSGSTLSLRFKNPPSSLSGARIAIEAATGGTTQENTINSQIAQALASELQSRGASVNVLNTGPSGAESWGADFLIGIRCNQNNSSTGAGAHYFSPFSQVLATNIASGASSGLASGNRGAVQSYYSGLLSSQMPSALLECGSLTSEYDKLSNTTYQKQVAVGVTEGIAATIKTHATGSYVSTPSGSGTTGSWNTGNAHNLESLKLQSALNLAVGGTTTLTPEFVPTTARDAIAWRSTDTSVATVDLYGKVTAVRVGSAQIIATAQATGKTASCTVTVQASGSTGVTLSPTSRELSIGEGFSISYSIQPQGSASGVTWTSSNADAISVDSSGWVTARKEGVAVITATTIEGGRQATCTVTVRGSGTVDDSGVSVSSAGSLWRKQTSLQVAVGGTQRLYVQNERSQDIRGTDFVWSSSDTSVAVVDRYGVVTGVRDGAITVTATASGHAPIQWTVSVGSGVANSSLMINPNSVTITRGQTGQLQVLLQGKSISTDRVHWRSENTNIATVSATGLVTAVASGETAIIIQSKDYSNLTARCVVTVRDSWNFGSGTSGGDNNVKVNALYIRYGAEQNASQLSLPLSTSSVLSFGYEPSGSAAPGVTWASDNSSVVTVNQQGQFTCVGRGTATITVTSNANTNIRTRCTITVY